MRAGESHNESKISNQNHEQHQQQQQTQAAATKSTAAVRNQSASMPPPLSAVVDALTALESSESPPPSTSPIVSNKASKVNTPPEIKHPLYRFFITGKFADAILRVNIAGSEPSEDPSSVDVPVHRVILASQSHGLDMIFSQAPEEESTLNDFEMRSRPCGIWSIVVQSEAAIRAILEWTYLRRVEVTRESCWAIIAIARQLFIFDLEEHASRWILNNLLENNPGVRKPLSEWFEFILAALRAQVSDGFVESLIEAAVNDDEDIEKALDESDASFLRYIMLRNLVRTSELMRQPLTGRQLRHVFKSVDYSQWPRNHLQQAYMDGLLPRDKISACIALSESQSIKKTIKSREEPSSQREIQGSGMPQQPRESIQAPASGDTAADAVPPTTDGSRLFSASLDARSVYKASPTDDPDMTTIKAKTTRLARTSIMDIAAGFVESAKDATGDKPTSSTDNNSNDAKVDETRKKQYAHSATFKQIPGVFPGIEIPSAAEPLELCAPIAVRGGSISAFVVASETLAESSREIQPTDVSPEDSSNKSVIVKETATRATPASAISARGSRAEVDASVALNAGIAAISPTAISATAMPCETPEQGIKEIQMQLNELLNEPIVTDCGDKELEIAHQDLNNSQSFGFVSEASQKDMDYAAKHTLKSTTASIFLLGPYATASAKPSTTVVLREVEARLAELSMQQQQAQQVAKQTPSMDKQVSQHKSTTPPLTRSTSFQQPDTVIRVANYSDQRVKLSEPDAAVVSTDNAPHLALSEKKNNLSTSDASQSKYHERSRPVTHGRSQIMPVHVEHDQQKPILATHKAAWAPPPPPPLTQPSRARIDLNANDVPLASLSGRKSLDRTQKAKEAPHRPQMATSFSEYSTSNTMNNVNQDTGNQDRRHMLRQNIHSVSFSEMTALSIQSHASTGPAMKPPMGIQGNRATFETAKHGYAANNQYDHQLKTDMYSMKASSSMTWNSARDNMHPSGHESYASRASRGRLPIPPEQDMSLQSWVGNRNSTSVIQKSRSQTIRISGQPNYSAQIMAPLLRTATSVDFKEQTESRSDQFKGHANPSRPHNQERSRAETVSQMQDNAQMTHDRRFTLPPPEASSSYMDLSETMDEGADSSRSRSGTFRILKLKHASYLPAGQQVPPPPQPPSVPPTTAANSGNTQNRQASQQNVTIEHSSSFMWPRMYHQNQPEQPVRKKMSFVDIIKGMM